MACKLRWPMSISIYLLVWAALTNLFCYFCGCFCYQEVLLVMNFRWQKCFTGNIEAICTISFKIRAKSRSKNPFQCAEEFAPVAVYVLEVPFSLASCHENLAFFFYTKVVSQCYMKVSFIPFFRSSL